MTKRATRETTVSSHGIDLFVRERGEGHPLLMINGLGGNLEMWGVAEDRLSSVARTIVFDAPGTGRSGTPVKPLSMHGLARSALDVLDELGYGRVDVLGFSLGGVIAQQLARDAPTRVRRLALAATACGWGSVPGTLPALALIAMPLRYYSRLFYEQTNRLLSPADGDLDGRLEAQADARLRYPPSLRGYTYQVWAGALWSSLAWLGRVKVPTLVLAGDADLLVPPANSFQLAGLLPNSRLHLLPDEGHLLLFDEQSGAHALLEDYFSSRTLRSSKAWAHGQVVDEETVEQAIKDSVSGEPYRSMSGAFRWFVQHAWAA